MRRRWAALAAVGVMALVSACGSDPVPAGPLVLRAEGVQRQQPPADAPVDAIVTGMTRFGYDLVPATAATNWAASPASIAIALAMARAGAGGTTAAEIDKAFGFPAAGLHEAFNALSRQLVTADVPPPPDKSPEPRKPGMPPNPTIACIGNAAFPAKGFPISEAYLHTLAAQYGTGVYPVDFHSDTAKESIDAWARQQTADRVKKVFDQIDEDTALVLANTVYLKGEWTTAFDKSSTVDADFHRADSSTVRVPMMHNEVEVDYAEGDGWQVVQVPYGDGAFAMRILLPMVETTPRDLLAPLVQAEVSKRLASQRVDLAMPRWDFAADVALKDELIRLGVVDAFDPDAADFSGMSTASLYIAQAVHRATITVDEYGTEAAAVTALAAMPTSAPPPPTVSLHADHPFAFAVIHVATGAPLFIGQVADPSAH